MRRPWWQKRARGPLVDIYTLTYIRIWLALQNGSVESVCDDSVGEVPEWYGRDVIETGWDSILGVLGCGSMEWASDLTWLLAYGIAPDQPFLVHLDTPRWYKSGGYEYPAEWDCDFNWEIVQVAPLAPSVVTERWAHAVRDEKSDREYMRRHRAELEYLQRTDVKSMFIKCESYFGPGQSSYDDMVMPRGLRYMLCSDAALPKEPRSFAYLVSGESDDGDRDRAFAQLLENAKKKLPGLPEETIRTMSRRSW